MCYRYDLKRGGVNGSGEYDTSEVQWREAARREGEELGATGS